jgi:hypothetical protein
MKRRRKKAESQRRWQSPYWDESKLEKGKKVKTNR